MKRNLTVALCLALGAIVTTSTLAAEWSSFESVFPVYPCQDGWSACGVADGVVSPNMWRDAQTRPQPADGRVGWFDLEPGPNFSPFPGFTAYTGVLKQEDDASMPAEVADGGQPVADARGSTPSNDAVADAAGAADEPGGSPQGDEPADALADGSADDAPPGGADAPADDSGSTTAVADPTNAAGDEPATKTEPAADPTPPPKGGILALGDSKAAEGTGDKAGTSEGSAEAGVVDCSNEKKLEPKAMLGRLDKAQKQCLEARIAGSTRITEKDKLSRVLIANSFASKGTDRGKLLKRHLTHIDRSDPDLCYKYASYLNKLGAKNAAGVIRWSEVALENKSAWDGATFKNRVYALYKLRAGAAQKMWQAAEEDFAKTQSDDSKAKRAKYRSTTKVYAREWYEYAKAAGKDPSRALDLCRSAAGTEAYCTQ